MKHDKANQVYKDLTQQMITALREGVDGKWEPPWTTSAADVWRPINTLTEKPYTAGNRFILSMTSAMTGASAYWGTYKQWAQHSTHTLVCLAARKVPHLDKCMTTYSAPTRAGCELNECEMVSVRAGETAAATLLRPLFRKEMNETGLEVERLFGWAAFKVFNSNQVSGWTPPDMPERTLDGEADEVFEWAATIGAKVEQSPTCDTPALIPVYDKIQMPSIERWGEVDKLWSIMAHELTHWTGQPERLDRKLNHAMINKEPWDEQDRAFEELIAELGSVFTLSQMGRQATFRDDHLQYLSGWLTLLEGDPKAMWHAASKAQQASDYLISAHEAGLEPRASIMELVK